MSEKKATGRMEREDENSRAVRYARKTETDGDETKIKYKEHTRERKRERDRGEKVAYLSFSFD